jgi:hypothetical protein
MLKKNSAQMAVKCFSSLQQALKIPSQQTGSKAQQPVTNMRGASYETSKKTNPLAPSLQPHRGIFQAGAPHVLSEDFRGFC